MASPSTLFKRFEESGLDFMITEHGYSPRYDQTNISGRYCVQFVSVVRGNGLNILSWWKDKCLEECSSDADNGQFGDQRYLEQAYDLFHNQIFVLPPRDAGFLAPWNVNRYRYSDAVLYHFHGFRIINYNKLIYARSYDIPKSVIENIYDPYALVIKENLLELKRFGFEDFSQVRYSLRLRLLELISNIFSSALDVIQSASNSILIR